MYRPEGFDAEKIAMELFNKPLEAITFGEVVLIEAGADAMLEGLLKRDGFSCYIHDNSSPTVLIPKPPMLPNGYLVFIPEE